MAVRLHPRLLVVRTLITVSSEVLTVIFLRRIDGRLCTVLRLSSLPSSLSTFLLRVRCESRILLALLRRLLRVPRLDDC